MGHRNEIQKNPNVFSDCPRTSIELILYETNPIIALTQSGGKVLVDNKRYDTIQFPEATFSKILPRQREIFEPAILNE